jgi:hypothetical protein
MVTLSVAFGSEFKSKQRDVARLMADHSSALRAGKVSAIEEDMSCWQTHEIRRQSP